MIASDLHRAHFRCRRRSAAAAMTLPLEPGHAPRPPRSCRRPDLRRRSRSAERLQRLAKAQELMRSSGIGAVLVESGPSLDYFTGVQWWRASG